MNIARKINTAALSAYQMIYNLLLIAVCVALTVVWLVSLVKNTTPWNGIDENDAWGVLVFGFLLGGMMIFVFAALIVELLSSVGIILGLIKTIKSKTRKTGFIFAIINTLSIFLGMFLIILGAAATVPSLEGSGKMFIPIIIVTGEVIAFLWNIVGFALHLFTDIPYFVAEKKKKVV